MVFVTSNKPIVICFGYQSLPQKLITNANTSQAHLDIHRSKLVIVKWHLPKQEKIHKLVFSTNPNNIFFANCLLEGKFNFGHKRKIKCFN